MARCKLTKMNLRNIRKSREYQCLLIDLVKTGVVGKTAAEGLLGYTIPAGLLGDTTPVTPPDDEDEPETEPRNVTVIYNDAHNLSNISNDYQSFDYDLNAGDSESDILAAAKNEFNDNTLNVLTAVSLEPVADKTGNITSYITNPLTHYDIEAGMTLMAVALEEEENPGKPVVEG